MAPNGSLLRRGAGCLPRALVARALMRLVARALVARALRLVASLSRLARALMRLVHAEHAWCNRSVQMVAPRRNVRQLCVMDVSFVQKVVQFTKHWAVDLSRVILQRMSQL